MPAVVIHGLVQAEAALAAAGPQGVLLLSPRGAGIYAGAKWFLAVIRRAAEARPGRRFAAALDCADDAGAALAALQAGVRVIILDPLCPAFSAVAAAAQEVEAIVLAAPPPHRDLAGFDPGRRADVAALRCWLTRAPLPPAAA